MKQNIHISPFFALATLFTLAAINLPGHDAVPAGKPPAQTSSKPGSNIWNEAQEPADWWGEIKRVHGHVGPWNVLGWRIGKAALRELNATWGQHEMDVVCHIPLQMPYSCLADGLAVGTGNSLGRLDLRLSEVMVMSDIHVSVRRKDGTGPVLLLKPSLKYLQKIHSQPDEKLEALARECGQVAEQELFEILNIQSSGKAPPKT